MFISDEEFNAMVKVFGAEPLGLDKFNIISEEFAQLSALSFVFTLEKLLMTRKYHIVESSIFVFDDFGNSEEVNMGVLRFEADAMAHKFMVEEGLYNDLDIATSIQEVHAAKEKFRARRPRFRSKAKLWVDSGLDRTK